jgi:branched-chain amino acid transport system ATP-binding protein
MSAPILEVEQLEVVYHDVATAVQAITLSVPEGSIVAMVGTNGAGKTTTLRAISGVLPAEQMAIRNGNVRFSGRSIKGLAPHVVVRMGIALVPERSKIFETLTVKDNLGMVPRSSRRGVSIEDVLGYFPRLRERATQIAGYLSGGEKQMLAIGMALLNRPRLLLIDELSLGLAPVVVGQLMDSLRRLNKELGLSILIVEQNAMAALKVASFGYVMENGRVVISGTAEELLRHQDVREFYLGGTDQQRSAKSYRDVKQYSRKRRWWG